jgi:PKD repeat protein
MKKSSKFSKLLLLTLLFSCSFGCKKVPLSNDLNNTISSLATASFTYTIDTSKVSTVIFKNTSIGGSSFLWEFGLDNKKSTLSNPIHAFPFDGETTVKLTAYDSLGKSNSYIGTVKIKSTKGRVFFCHRKFLSDPALYPFYFQFGSDIWGQGTGGGTLNKFYLTNTPLPNCSDSGVDTYIQNVGTYDYMAKGQKDQSNWLTWSGKYNVTAGGCTTVIFNYRDGK